MALLESRLQGTSLRLKLGGDPLPSDTGSPPVTQETRNDQLSKHPELHVEIYVYIGQDKGEQTFIERVRNFKRDPQFLVQRCVRANRPTTFCLRGHGSDVNKRLDRGDPSLMPNGCQHPEITATQAEAGCL